jgi:hypothetical protein
MMPIKVLQNQLAALWEEVCELRRENERLRSKDMKGSAVPIMGIHLVRQGDHAVVEVEFPGGQIKEVIREHIDGPFSHWISEHGLVATLHGVCGVKDAGAK